MSSRRIVIENLKGIGYLEFEVPESGVHVLTGENGTGKSTLLTCLSRPGDSIAFYHAARAGKGKRVDFISDARVTYINAADEKVTYSYKSGDLRWLPSPWNRSDVMKRFFSVPPRFFSAGMQGVRFSTNAKEIPHLKTWKDDELCLAMNSLFNTNRFEKLRFVKTRASRGSSASRRDHQAIVMESGHNEEGNAVYFSERNFSTGELLLVNLLYELKHRTDDGAFVLIDELEIALHPAVQVRFYNYLQTLAKTRGFTFLISTHSSSIIRHAKNLIVLTREVNSSAIRVEYNCQPAYALRMVADLAEVTPERIICVEDTMARELFQQMTAYYWRRENKGTKPYAPVIPVGGARQLMEFVLNISGTAIPEQVPVIAIPDRDVEHELIPFLEKSQRGKSPLLELYQKLQAKKRISFLPVTPEEGLVMHIEANQSVYETYFVKMQGLHQVNLSAVLNSPEYIKLAAPVQKQQAELTALQQKLATAATDEEKKQVHAEIEKRMSNSPMRGTCKNKLNRITRYLAGAANKSDDRIIEQLFYCWVESVYADTETYNQLKGFIGKIYNTI